MSSVVSKSRFQTAARCCCLLGFTKPVGDTKQKGTGTLRKQQPSSDLLRCVLVALQSKKTGGRDAEQRLVEELTFGGVKYNK